jgi:enoyl-CoA hydratase/carnithine racemase
MELTAVRFEVDHHVATVWLHRPHRHNAWTGRMHREYREVLSHLHDDPAVRAVVVTGTPPAFCVGGDSEALAGHAERGAYDPGLDDAPIAPGYGVRPEFDADFAFQFALRFPVIAAVNGATAGVGLALALFCDLRFGAAPAKLTTAARSSDCPPSTG